MLNDQLARVLKEQHAFAIQTKFFLGANTRIMKAIRQTGKVPDDVPEGLRAVYPSYLGKFLQSEFAVEPAKLATSYGGLVLEALGLLFALAVGESASIGKIAIFLLTGQFHHDRLRPTRRKRTQKT